MAATVKERLDKHDRQLAQHDKQIAAIRNLLQEGVRMVIQHRKDMRELAAAQKKTDVSLKALIDSMRGGGNGHTKRSV